MRLTRRCGLALLLVPLGLATGCATGITGPVTNVEPTSASFRGGLVTTTVGTSSYWAEYGPTTAYGSETPHQGTFTDTGQASFTITLTGLQRSTTYHYRVCAADSEQGPGQEVCGRDRRFTTQAVGCGETVTSDVRLTGPLRCGEDESGLVVGADGVEINLGGHTLSGAANTISRPNGIFVFGRTGTTIRNGDLRNWGSAIALRNAGATRIVNVDAEGFIGLDTQGGNANVVRRSSLDGGDGGIRAIDETGLDVAGSEVSGTAIVAMALRGDGARIADNTFTVFGPVPAIHVLGSTNRIAENTVRPGTGDSLLTGIWLAGGDGNALVRNVVSGAVAGSGETAGDGIFVGADTTGTLVRANVSIQNADDGIDVRSASTRIGDNQASNNGDLGIAAVAGVTDLGGNVAFGNGCTNVFCEH